MVKRERTQATRAFKLDELKERPHEGPAVLIVIAGALLGQRIELGDAEITIGRSREAGFQIPHEGVSRLHCRVSPEDQDYRIDDLGSTNRTLLNGEPVDSAVLKDGDRIKLGDTVLKFFAAGSLESDYQQSLVARAAFDDLTQLLNRRQFILHLSKAIEVAKGRTEPLILVLADLDHFKPINDTHGHLAGDEVLKTVSGLLRDSLPARAEVGRLGGEEFAVLLREHSLQQALDYAELLRAQIARTITHTSHGLALQVTCSFGVALWNAGFHSHSDLLRAADLALYEAKAQGRNRVALPPGT